jgi:hypothetical protein
MNPMAKRFIEVLQEDVRHWEEAAKSIDSVVPILIGDDQKQQWRATAEEYRARANSHRALIDIVKADKA